MGLCSYLLIGFWFSDKANADAGKKAFIVNRIGDFGFLVAMFLHLAARSGRSTSPHRRASAPPTCSAGRRDRHRDHPVPLPRLHRQVGADPALHLAARRHGRPDAGLGPDPRGHDGDRRRLPGRPHQRALRAWPRSRARWWPGSARSPRSSRPRSASGSTTSRRCWRTPPSPSSATCSSAWAPAPTWPGIFHLVTHAFFKALLFLGSGSVIHAMHHAYHATHSHEDAQDMRNMGGLRQYMPWTFGLMLIATLAIAGIPPFSGFFSKDEILAAAFARGARPAGLLRVLRHGRAGGAAHRVLHGAAHGDDLPGREPHRRGGARRTCTRRPGS